MPSRLILLPNIITHRQGANGREEVHTPDFALFDAKPDRFEVRSDYRDVSKVMVTLAEKPLRDLAERSKAYFEGLWKQPTTDEDADAG